MHRPPAASYQVGRSRWLAGGLFLIWLLATVNLTVFTWLQQQREASLVMSLVCLLAGAWAWRGWRAMPTGKLHWDGEHLHWQGFEAPVGAVHILLDMDFLLFLHLTSGLKTHYLVLTADKKQDWAAIRRVVVALEPRMSRPTAG